MSAKEKTKAADRRPSIYAGLNLAFLVFYILLAVTIAPARHTFAALLEWTLVGAMLLCVLGCAMRSILGWRLAVVGCSLLLVAELVLLVLILLSASYLAGVYGSFGRGASALALVVAALSIELVALLPALQLKYLLTRAGRRAFGLAK